MRVLRLMADYECYPIWDPASMANVDPATLDLPPDLATALRAWGDEYTATLDRSNPAASGFPDVPSARSWLRTGDELAARLRAEGFSVDYFHEVESPSDIVLGG